MASASGPALDAESEACLGLLDVLEQLPRDVLRRSVWLSLNTDDDDALASSGPSKTLGRAFRLTCQHSRQLADQLTRRLHLKVAYTEANVPFIESDSAHVRRQEGLHELGLSGGHDFSLAKMLQLSGGVGRQVQVLLLSDYLSCAWLAGDAVWHCYCNIRELRLDSYGLDSTFFEGAQHCSKLVKVVMGSSMAGDFGKACGETLHMVAQLPHLETLAFTHLSGVERAHNVAEPLAALTRLKDLCLGGLVIYMTRAAGSALGQALGGLTCLTALELPAWQITNWDEPDALPEIIDSVVAQLGGLRRLVHLADMSDVSDTPSSVVLVNGFAALCQLSALTYLGCRGAPPLPVPAADCLPFLRQLHLNGAMDAGVLGPTLLPLLPLAELKHMSFSVNLRIDHAAAAGGDPNAIGRASDAMWQAATLLRQAPRLKQLEVTMGVFHLTDRPPVVGVAIAVLVPLRDTLTALTLQNLPAGLLETVWPVLCMASRLETLRLVQCGVSDSWLVCLGQHLPGLRNFEVTTTQRTQAVAVQAVVALAAVRLQPLRVGFCPSLSTELQRVFQAAARAGGAVLVDMPGRCD